MLSKLINVLSAIFDIHLNVVYILHKELSIILRWLRMTNFRDKMINRIIGTTTELDEREKKNYTDTSLQHLLSLI